MNRYGRMAMQHWSWWLPQRVAGIPDPVSFFSTLGLDVARQIDLLSDRLAGWDRQGETHLQKIGRLREARMTAESDILRQEVLLAPENEGDRQQPWPAPTPWILTSEASADPDDPIWQQEQQSSRRGNPT